MSSKKEERQETPFSKQLAQKTRMLYQQSFAEVYIEGNSGTGGNKTASQSVTPLNPDIAQKKKRFLDMRHLYSSVRMSGRVYDKVQASSFVRQAKFMADFEDDYEDTLPFSMYYPDYQMMGFEQLRTYFTWRTNVRKGIVKETSLSYVFIYIYELINHVGAENSEDGLQKLLFLWENYRGYEAKLDKYMAQWFKDYYITGDFPVPFGTLVRESALLRLVYGEVDNCDFYKLYANLGDYKPEKSIFFTPETEKIIRECFAHTIQTLIDYMQQSNVDFDDLIFFSNKGNAWSPFDKALYYQKSGSAQKKKTVKISHTEVYWYDNGHWISSLNRVCKENGRYIIGYILRRMEQFYRKALHFKYQLNVNRAKIKEAEMAGMGVDCDGFFACIDGAVTEFYRNSQKKTITVDLQNLEKIRANALATQEKLLVTAEDAEDALTDREALLSRETGAQQEFTAPKEIALPQPASPTEAMGQPSVLLAFKNSAIPEESNEEQWKRFAASLSDVERAVLSMIIHGSPLKEIHEFAKNSRSMLEVLVDGINEKAVETINDTVMDLADTIEVFEEYREDLERGLQ